ncbi:MAG: monovalent cation/H+ antiporter subunit D family protein [Gemmatimonadota bacterium]
MNDILLTLAIPAIGAVAIGLLGRWPNARETALLLTAAILFSVVVRFYPAVIAGARPAVSLLQVAPGLELRFEVEPLGLVFALVASSLWFLTSLYAIGYMRGHHEKNQTRFYIFFALAISSAMGVAFAGNLFTLFMFYEVLTFSTFPLVTHHGTPEARRAGRVYLGILVSTSVGLQLLAIAWTWVATGTLDFQEGGILAGHISATVLPILLALYVFGIGKAAVMPFHRWLPAAMVAPTPVSALLHAVAVVKAGVFSILKVSVYVFGIDFLHQTGASVWLMWVAAATILLGSLVAFTKDNLKARLAYSTISQLSYIVLGAMLATRWGIVGGGMHIVMHAFGKITLFFCAGAIMVAAHKTEISEMDGLGRTMPITFAAFLIGSLSIIGLPPAGGSWSKWFLGLGALDAGQIGLVAVLMLSSLLSMAYLLIIPVRAFFLPPSEDDHHHDGIHEAPWPSLVALMATAILTVALFFYPDPFYELMLRVVGP